jgi:hypothetical protein
VQPLQVSGVGWCGIRGTGGGSECLPVKTDSYASLFCHQCDAGDRKTLEMLRSVSSAGCVQLQAYCSAAEPLVVRCLQDCALLQQGVPAAAPQGPQASLQEDRSTAGLDCSCRHINKHIEILRARQS